MSVKHMILGCLLEDPAHGYEIRQRFKTFYNQSHGLNEGQLYTTLKKMEDEGLVTREIVHQEKTPSKKVLRLTEQGRREFFRWLQSDEEQEPVVFNFFHVFPFLQKCNYFMHFTGEEALDQINRQIERERQQAEEFKRVRDGMVSRSVNWHRLTIIEFGISFQEMKIKWLSDLAGEVQSKPLPPQH